MPLSLKEKVRLLSMVDPFEALFELATIGQPGEFAFRMYLSRPATRGGSG